jgi:hypothetical protein
MMYAAGRGHIVREFYSVFLPLEPSCFYLFMFFLLTQMHSMNSVGGCKTLNSVGC